MACSRVLTAARVHQNRFPSGRARCIRRWFRLPPIVAGATGNDCLRHGRNANADNATPLGYPSFVRRLTTLAALS